MINISIKKPKPVLVMVHNASKGLRGVGLSGVTLDKDGNLIFTMSDGTVQTIKGYSQDLVNTTNEINNIKGKVSTIANNAADSAKEAKETADSIKQEYDRVEGATNSGLALIERSVLYGINRVKEATKACKSDALANIELAHKDAIDDIAIRRLEALQDIAGANAAAVSSAAAAKTSEINAKASETNAAASASIATTQASNASKSATAAKVSETNAKTSETNAGASATTAKNWAVSETSPDGATDTSSGTGKTQSSRTWALESKASAQSASSSASTATTQASSATASAKSASTSATSASDSATSAASSATAAKNSATAAASSASSASTSATNAKAAMNTANTAASSASTSATNASTSASNASKSEIAAKTAQAAAEKARDDANSAVAKLTGAMKYAGQVDNYSDLSDVTKNTGDVWNIVNADPEHGIKAGDNVAWNGTDWDDLSGTVDLSIYAEKADYQKAITSATANGGTITFNHKDGTTSTATVNNVASATAATNDAKGQKIDTTYEKIADASNVHTSLQNSINSLSTGKQDKLTFDTTPIAGSSNPVTSGGIKTALDTKLNKTDAANTYLDKLSKTEQVVTAPIKGTLNGNASSATKLANARTINVQDSTKTHTGTGVSFNGTGDAVITLPYDIDLTSLNFPLSGGQIRKTDAQESKSLAIFSKANDFIKPLIDLDPVNNKIDIQPGDGTTTKRYRFSMNGAEFSITGNAASATKLETARTINVTDADGTNTGTGASFNGTANATVKLPATIKANLTGNAATATNATNDGNGNPIASTYLPLAGGTMTGSIQYVDNGKVFAIGKPAAGNVDLGWNWDKRDGAGLGLRSTDYSSPGEFMLFARDANNTCSLTGKPGGSLTWNNKEIATTEFVNTKAGNYLPLSGGTLTGVVNGVTPTAGDNSKKLATTEFVNAKAGLPVGFEYFTTNPNVPAGLLPLLGGEYSRETYADLWAWVQTQNGYLLEESAWQAKAAANGGNVPFYSKGDGSTTFRVPALKCWVRGANSINEIGGYLAAGLPNITGGFCLETYYNKKGTGDGAFHLTLHDPPGNGITNADNLRNYANMTFDASRSSAIYGNSSTVQPESIVGMWVVKAYGTVTNVGSTDVANISTGLTQAETRISTAETRISAAVPTGVVQAFAGSTTPQGWLLCDGAAVSRTDYAALFAVIGTTYGKGNGSTTFNLPNLVDKFVEGSATAGTVKSAGLPNITGKLSAKNDINNVTNIDQFLADKLSEVSGAFSVGGNGIKKGISDGRAGYGYDTLNFNASASNPIYGKSNTVQPPALTMRYIIKY